MSPIRSGLCTVLTPLCGLLLVGFVIVATLLLLLFIVVSLFARYDWRVAEPLARGFVINRLQRGRQVVVGRVLYRLLDEPLAALQTRPAAPEGCGAEQGEVTTPLGCHRIRRVLLCHRFLVSSHLMADAERGPVENDPLALERARRVDIDGIVS